MAARERAAADLIDGPLAEELPRFPVSEGGRKKKKGEAVTLSVTSAVLA